MENVMDAFLKGLVVQIIEQLLVEEHLRSVIKSMDLLKPAITSIEDAVFGHVIGELEGRMKVAIYTGFKREANRKEEEIIANAILRSALEIKSKIRECAHL